MLSRPISCLSSGFELVILRDCSLSCLRDAQCLIVSEESPGTVVIILAAIECLRVPRVIANSYGYGNALGGSIKTLVDERLMWKK